MKSQHVNKVDLSLDDIIKMDGLNRPQDQNRGGNNQNRGGNNQHRGGNNQNRGGNNQNRGGNNQNRGGNNQNRGGNNNRGLMNQRNNGQGQRGFRPSGQQGGGQGFNGVSPLNRGKVSGMTMMARRGQMTGASGQRVNTGTWSGKYGGGGGGGKWGGGGGQGNNSGWTNNNMTRQTNNRQFNSSRPERTGQGGNPMYQRGHQGKFTQGSGQQWGRQNNMGRQGPGNMPAGNTSRPHQGGQGQGRVMRPGDLRITVDHKQAELQGQGQPRQGLKDMTFDQKRRKAMQALREARKTIAQLDQQSAREQMVNTRRGIAPQSPGSSFKTTHDDHYGGTISDFSESCSSSESDMEDQPIMSFKMASPASRCSSNTSRHKRWQHKSTEGNHSDSTLTISIDNSAPFVSHSELALTKNHIPLSPHSSHGSLHRGKRHQGQSPRRRKQQQHYPQQPEDNIPHAHSPQSPPDPHSRQHNNSHLHWHPQEEARVVDTVDMRRGATPGFSQQLAHLKPTVAMRYAFQKKTFSAASTPVSLNDRFSEPDDPAGRKVFM